MLLLAHAAVTPVGNPVAVPIPVAPVVACVMDVNAVLIHNVGALEAALTVLTGVTVMVPIAVLVPQPPVKVTVYVAAPETLGVPVMVAVFDDQEPVTPAGNPLKDAPEALVVV